MNYPSTSLPYLIIVIIIIKNNNSDDSNIDLLVDNPRGGPSCPLFPSRIGSWKCWFLRREENRRPGEKKGILFAIICYHFVVTVKFIFKIFSVTLKGNETYPKCDGKVQGTPCLCIDD